MYEEHKEPPPRAPMTYCDEYEGGCGASLTETDFECGYCTQCKRRLSAKESGTMSEIPEIVRRAMTETIVSIGQLTDAEKRTLNKYVKRGWLSTTT